MYKLCAFEVTINNQYPNSQDTFILDTDALDKATGAQGTEEHNFTFPKWGTGN